jgi:hypothetical protein
VPVRVVAPDEAGAVAVGGLKRKKHPERNEDVAMDQMEEALRNLLRGMNAEERSKFMIGVETNPDVQTVMEIAEIVVDVEREQR